jgi:hypothetical protein
MRALALCDLVADAINDADVLPHGAVAARRLYAEFDAPAVADVMQVVVVPGGRTFDPETRAMLGETIEVQIGFRVRAESDEDMEDAGSVVDAVMDAVANVELGDWGFVGAESDTPYDHALYREQRLFATVAKISYRRLA